MMDETPLVTTNLDSLESAGITPPPKNSWGHTRTGRVVLTLLSVVVVCGVLLLVNGGHPYSNWYYAIFVVSPLPALYDAVMGRPQPKLPRNPPMEQNAALREAVWQAFSFAVWYYAVMLTGFGYVHQWGAGLIIGAILGSMYYQWYRGRKPSRWYFTSVTVGAMFLIAGIAIWQALRH